MDFNQFIKSRDIKEHPDEYFGYGSRIFRVGKVILEEPKSLMALSASNYAAGSVSLSDIRSSFTKKIDFYLAAEDNGSLIGTEFRIIRIPEKNHLFRQFNRGVIRQYLHESRLLIPPFFKFIIFKKEFNIFICARDIDNNTLSYDRYYFDINGRYIHKEKHSPSYLLPTVGFDATSNSVIKIKPLPPNFWLKRAIDLYTYEVGANYLSGIIDYAGNWLIEPIYTQIIFWKENNFAIVGRNRDYYALNRTDKTLKKLDFQVYDSNLDALRICTEKDDKYKWGLMNTDMQILHKPIYDFIDYCYTSNRNIVFIGPYLTKEDIETEGTFLEDYDFASKLTLGKCGVINKKGIEIIPIEQDYIKEIGRGKFMVNNGCEIFEVYYENNDDDREKFRVIRNGKWYIYDIDGNLEKEITKSEAQLRNDEFRYAVDEEISIE